MQYLSLANGIHIPAIGFGTYKSTDMYGQRVLEDALACGYRHMDTATLYRNEAQLGLAIAASGIARNALFLSSKAPQNDLGYDPTLRHFSDSLHDLKTHYLDLYLIHWPTKDWNSVTWKQDDIGTWRAMEWLYEQKAVRAIGVCNFLPHHLLNLFSAANVKPMVNQLEFHPGYPQYATLQFCRENGIQAEAWSPMGRGRVLDHPVLHTMAERYGKTVSQLCIRFALQSGVIPLPKSSGKEHMLENLNVFDFTLSEEDYYRLLTLPQVGWSGKHPDFERVPPT